MKRQDVSEPPGSKKFKWNPDDSSTLYRPPAATVPASTMTTGTQHQHQHQQQYQHSSATFSTSTTLPASTAMSPEATAALASYYAYYYPHLFGASPSATGAYQDSKSYSVDPSLAGHHGYHAYGYTQPHLASPATPASSSSRSIYLGNVPLTTTFEDIFNLIHHGVVDAVRRLVEKNCAFIDFADPQAAALFLADYTARGLTLGGQTLKVSYATGSSALNPAVTLALSSGGSRVLYLCQLLPTHTHPSPPIVPATTEYLNPEWLRRNLSNFGEIESIKVLSDKKTSFVYFTSILTAVSAVANLSGDPRWQGLKISYGKDRCAPAGLSHLNVAANGPFHANVVSAASSPSYMTHAHAHTTTATNAATNLPAVTIYPGPTLPGVPVPFTSDHRTLFLGSLPAATTLSDLANAIRGGSIYNLKILEEKHCAFVTFIDAEAAYAFYAAAIGPLGVFSSDAQASSSSFNTNTNVVGVAIHGRKITKIGFSKPFPLTLSVADMIQYDHATRTLYLTPSTVTGSSTSRELPLMAEVRAMFEPFGPLESINLIPGKNVMFINYANLLSAVKALAALKDAGKGRWRLYYGRDRSAGAFVPFKNHGLKQEASKLDLAQSTASDVTQENDMGMFREQVIVDDHQHENNVHVDNDASNGVDNDVKTEAETETSHAQGNPPQPSFEDLETLFELEDTLVPTVQSIPSSE